MAVSKPFRRCCRQLLDGSYQNNGNWLYLIHPQFAQDPQHYIRAFFIIQKDLLNLFEFVEPCNQNLKTISFRIHELLVRTCVEIEANFTAILKENGYNHVGDLTRKDYKLVNITHRLSSFEVSLPVWNGVQKKRCPFKGWSNGAPLDWYDAYNKAKHDRHTHFFEATFDNLLDAISGLVILLSAQFGDEDYSPNEKGISVGGGYSYNSSDGLKTAIGDYFRIKFPDDWPLEQRYSFEWKVLAAIDEPIATIDYNVIKTETKSKSNN